jgi:hypothetical protein
MTSQEHLDEYNVVKHLLNIRYSDEEKKEMIKNGKMKSFRFDSNDPNWQQKMIDTCPELFPEGFVAPQS